MLRLCTQPPDERRYQGVHPNSPERLTRRDGRAVLLGHSDGGCASAAPGGKPLFCPEPTPGSGTRGLVTRQQMALFLLRTAQVSQDGTNLPPYAGTFSDVLDSVPGRFIEELARRDVTTGCASAAGASGKPAYCPSAQVSRQAMAVFLVRMFDLPTS